MTAKRRWNRRIPAALLIALAGWLLAGAALAEHGNRRSTSRGSANQRSTASRPGIPRSLLPPAGLGSAANAPPGFYHQNLSVPGPRRAPGHRHPGAGHPGSGHPGSGHPGSGHPGPIYVPYPYVVYVEPPQYAVPPPVYEPPPPQDTAPYQAAAPAQQPLQPIYVVQQAPPAPSPPPSPAPPPPAAAPAPKEPTPVTFTVRPPDAEVYLDDDYLGTGAELAGQQLLLPPRVYVLEVSHPEHPSQRLVFGVGAGDPLEVLIDLGAERRGQRSRLR